MDQKMKTVIAEPLTQECFAPYGDVIELEGRDFFHINGGQTERYHRLAEIDVRNQDYPIISLVKSKPINVPVEIDMLERHPFGSQAFMPINGEQFLIVVAEAGEEINPATIRCFVTNGRQGVSYRLGVWHFPILALGKEAEMLVVDRGGPDNCDERSLCEPFQLTIDPQRLPELVHAQVEA